MQAVKNYSSWNSATIKTFCCIYPIPKKMHLKGQNLQPITSDVNNIKDDCNVFEMYEW